MEEVLSFSITLIIVMNITFIYFLHLKDRTTSINQSPTSIKISKKKHKKFEKQEEPCCANVPRFWLQLMLVDENVVCFVSFWLLVTPCTCGHYILKLAQNSLSLKFLRPHTDRPSDHVPPHYNHLSHHQNLHGSPTTTKVIIITSSNP